MGLVVGRNQGFGSRHELGRFSGLRLGRVILLFFQEGLLGLTMVLGWGYRFEFGWSS